MVTVKLCDTVSKGDFKPDKIPLKDKYECLYINDENHQVSACMTHPLIECVLTAYNRHLPLKLRPDDIWLTIAHGICQHINLTPQSFRDKFVSHKGKLKLTAVGMKFEDAISKMVGEISSHCKNQEFIKMMLNTFSTSTQSTLIASHANLMGSMSKYFQYEMTLLCGIPSVTLDGTLEDWAEIARRIRSLRDLKIGLNWWSDELAPVVDQLVKTYQGEVDLNFWGHILDAENMWGSGGTILINGWISKLFPYDRHGKKRQLQTDSDMFSRGISKVAFVLDETHQDLEIVSGFLGMDVDLCGTVSPYIGWYVKEKRVSHSEQLSTHANIVEGLPNKCCTIA